MVRMSEPASALKHVLLLEDDHDIRTLLRMFLEEQGLYVTMTDNAADARTILERVKIDAMISNMVLPGGTAFVAVDFARQKGIPALLITGSVEQMAQLEADGEYFLAKPFRLAELTNRLYELMARSANETGTIRDDLHLASNKPA